MIVSSEDPGLGEVLRLRARLLAEGSVAERTDGDSEAFVVVLVGSEALALPLAGLVELQQLPPVAHVPKLPRWIRGLAQCRGEAVSVVDLARLLGIPDARAGGYWVVVDGAQGRFGLVIDGVLGVSKIASDELAADNLRSVAARSIVRGVTRNLVSIVDVGQLARSVVVDSRPEPSRGGRDVV